jgi:hypothetical protein
LTTRRAPELALPSRSRASIAFVWLVTLTCGGCTTHEIRQEIPSPSGRWTAVVTAWQPPGGALADDQYTIHVVRTGSVVPMWLRAPWRARAPWFSEFVPPAYVFWRDERSLEVVVLAPSAGGSSWIRQRSSRFRLVTREVEHPSKAVLRRLEELPLARARRTTGSAAAGSDE